jgi:hypothetical protein
LWTHATIFEGLPEEAAYFHLRGHVQSYKSFREQNRHFFVFGRYDYPEDWLLRKLTADGATIRVVGRVADTYKDREVYEVTF